MIIAIDGLGVNGKSTLAKMIAHSLGIKYFNTGAIYRCIALEIINKDLNINDISSVIKHLNQIDIDFIDDRVFLSGENVTDEIRTETISVKSTEWATIPEIKELVRKIQKDFISKNDVVIEGRDICTRIAPNADYKFYFYSDFETRVKRLYEFNKNIDINTVRNNRLIRDRLDLEGGNFIKPQNAIEIDTTNLTINEVFDIIIGKINYNNRQV